MKLYIGSIVLGPQILNSWIPNPNHSFASREWVEGQIRYGLWEIDREDMHHREFHVRSIVQQGTYYLNVNIKGYYYFQGTPQNPYPHVFAYHAHCWPRKR